MNDIQTGTVARYCKPSTLDEQGKPTSSSFQLRLPKEKYLSVFLLDFFSDPTEIEKIEQVKIEMQRKGFGLKKTGLFSTLDIEESKKYISNLISQQISYKELNLPHCGIYHENDDLVISVLLSCCIKNCYSSDLITV